MPENKGGNSLLHWIIFVALAITWGSSFILMKRGLEVFSAGQVAGLRIFMAFLFLAPLSFIYVRRSMLQQHWKGFLGMGVTGNLIPAFLFTAAETGISSSLTGMLNSLTPIFTLLVGMAVFQLRPGKMQVLGLLLGLAGAVALVATGKSEGENTHLAYSGLVVLATFFYGVSVNIIKSKLGGVNAVAATTCALLLIGPPAGVYVFCTDFLERMQTHPQAWSALGYTAILAVFGTALSVIVYNILIKQAGTLFAASVTYAIPIVAMFWGVYDGEEVTGWHALFIIVILSGVWLVTRKRS